MSDPTQTPIIVNATPTQDQIQSGLRYILTALSAVAMALGFSGVAGKFTALLMAVGPMSAAVAFLWGQWSARHKAKQAATMAKALPDSVAQIK